MRGSGQSPDKLGRIAEESRALFLAGRFADALPPTLTIIRDNGRWLYVADGVIRNGIAEINRFYLPGK